LLYLNILRFRSVSQALENQQNERTSFFANSFPFRSTFSVFFPTEGKKKARPLPPPEFRPRGKNKALQNIATQQQLFPCSPFHFFSPHNPNPKKEKKKGKKEITPKT
jgi:hypothetical protein